MSIGEKLESNDEKILGARHLESTEAVAVAEAAQAVDLRTLIAAKIAPSPSQASQRTKKIQAAVTPEFYMRVQVAAAKQHMNVSDYVRKILELTVPELDS